MRPLTRVPATDRCMMCDAHCRGEVCPACDAEAAAEVAEMARLTAAGHTEHCAARHVWGDGECECDVDYQAAALRAGL